MGEAAERLKFNFDSTLFRASKIGKLMTNPRTKGETLSETTKTYLIEVMVNELYGRKKDVSNKYIEKGLMCEEDSLTLFSRVLKLFYTKNEKRFENDYVCGTPDIINDGTIYDIKTSWDIFTYFDNKASKEINKDYYWQLQAYMALTGAKAAKLVYCLVNTPYILIDDEKRKLMYKMNAGTSQNEDFEKACVELEKNLVYDDMPMSERVYSIDVPRNDEDIAKMYERVVEARKWLNNNFKF